MAANSGKTARRGAGRQFKPGQSGNPSGRPKRTQEQKDALEELKKLTPAAVQAVNEILRDQDAPESARLRAAEIVFDRTYGKPEARVSADVMTGSGDFILRIVGDDADD